MLGRLLSPRRRDELAGFLLLLGALFLALCLVVGVAVVLDWIAGVAR